jgi:hypothetical protein
MGIRLVWLSTADGVKHGFLRGERPFQGRRSGSIRRQLGTTKIGSGSRNWRTALQLECRSFGTAPSLRSSY